MSYNADILLGTITKLHGYEGAVTVRLEKTFTENIPDMESVFLEIEGKPVPFFVSESDYPGGNILRMKFEGYDSAEKVVEFSGCRVFLSKKQPGTISYEKNEGLTGYKLYLADNSLIGEIHELIENPGQILLVVKSENGQELLIPLHEDLVVKVDKKKSSIIMDLPEGLTDLN
jgi:16S rRNA processing protein RimM